MHKFSLSIVLETQFHSRGLSPRNSAGTTPRVGYCCQIDIERFFLLLFVSKRETRRGGERPARSGAPCPPFLNERLQRQRFTAQYRLDLERGDPIKIFLCSDATSSAPPPRWKGKSKREESFFIISPDFPRLPDGFFPRSRRSRFPDKLQPASRAQVEHR